MSCSDHQAAAMRPMEALKANSKLGQAKIISDFPTFPRQGYCSVLPTLPVSGVRPVFLPLQCEDYVRLSFPSSATIMSKLRNLSVKRLNLIFVPLRCKDYMQRGSPDLPSARSRPSLPTLLVQGLFYLISLSPRANHHVVGMLWFMSKT